MLWVQAAEGGDGLVGAPPTVQGRDVKASRQSKVGGMLSIAPAGMGTRPVAPTTKSGGLVPINVVPWVFIMLMFMAGGTTMNMMPIIILLLHSMGLLEHVELKAPG